MILNQKILFTKEECDKILSHAEQSNNRNSYLIPKSYEDTKYKIGGKMMSNTLILGNENLWFMEKIIDWANSLPNIEKIINNNLYTQIRYYKTGDFFAKHNDHYRNGIKRVYTIGVFLNSKEDFTGGDFKIYNGNNSKIIDFETGKVYIIESSTLHSVELITSGNRMSLIIFIEKNNLYNAIKSKNFI